MVDANSKYGMVERFQFEESHPYPGKASIIFWTNGPELKLNTDGEASLSSSEDGSPYYMEAEINSPLCRLRPGEACNLDTEWFPMRVGSELRAVSEAGIVVHPLKATLMESGKIKLAGAFGIFSEGQLVAHSYDHHGSELQKVPTCSKLTAAGRRTWAYLVVSVGW